MDYLPLNHAPPGQINASALGGGASVISTIFKMAQISHMVGSSLPSNVSHGVEGLPVWEFGDEW